MLCLRKNPWAVSLVPLVRKILLTWKVCKLTFYHGEDFHSKKIMREYRSSAQASPRFSRVSVQLQLQSQIVNWISRAAVPIIKARCSHPTLPSQGTKTRRSNQRDWLIHLNLRKAASLLRRSTTGLPRATCSLQQTLEKIQRQPTNTPEIPLLAGTSLRLKVVQLQLEAAAS